MAFYCIDYNNGSNTTGDGTASAPWATVAHAETQINGGAGYVAGDEMRIAGSTLSASLGTVQWASGTSSSFSVSTDTDLTGSISAGDYLVIGTTADAGAMPTPLRVNAITSNSISFYVRYYSAMWTGVSYDVYKVNDFVVHNVTGFTTLFDQFNTQSQSFTAFSDTITISGGWDPSNFTSKTAYGKTAIVREGTYQATNGGPYGIVYQQPSGTDTDGFLFKDFGISRLYFYRYPATSDYIGHNYDGFSAVDNFETSYQVTTGTRSVKNFIIASPTRTIFGSGLSGAGTPVDFDGLRIGIGGNTSVSGDVFEPLGASGNNDRINSITNTNVYFWGRGSNPIFLYSTNVTYDPATINIFKDSPSVSPSLWELGSVLQFDPTVVVLNDSFIGNFGALFGSTSVTSRNLQIADISNMIKLTNYDVYYGGPAEPDFKLTESSTGTVYRILGNTGGAQINTVDNATGNNCIQLTAFGLDNIISNLTNFNGRPGDTVTIDISAKILGSNTSCTPTLKMALLGTSANYSRVSNGLNETTLTKSAGTSFNNTAYSTLTYTGTVSQYSSYANNTYQLSTRLDTGSEITSGNSLLIDSITVTVS